MKQTADSPAVKAWRDKFRLNLSQSWKHDVDITVLDLTLWEDILAHWKWEDDKGKWHRKAPGIKALLDEYERRSFDAIQQESSRVYSEESLPQKRDWQM